MLKYLRRQTSNRSHEDGSKANDVSKRDSLRSSSSFCDDFSLENDSNSTKECGLNISDMVADMRHGGESFDCQSRLSMSLSAIISDQNCLIYFIQYLESKNSLPLIKFYLDTEHFKTAALTQMKIEEKLKNSRLESIPRSHEDKELEEKEHFIENEGKKDNSLPELKTLCDLSMRKPLTDDEKSQIYAETNKKITKIGIASAVCKIKSKSELSLCSNEDGELNMDSNEYSKDSCVTAASIKDAISIYQKYLIPSSQQFVILPVSVLSQISLLLCKREDDATLSKRVDFIPISATCFLEAQHCILKQIEDNYLLDFQQSTFYCKYCVDLIGDVNNSLGSKLSIYDILYSETALFFFMEFLEQEKERNCLDFWTAAINYRKSYVNDIKKASETPALSMESKNLAQADAMVVYEKYFSLQSEHRLWLSDKLRCNVEECICSPENVAKCFDLALYVIEKYLEKKYLQRFLKSSLFANYLNELKLKIRENSVNNDVTPKHSIRNTSAKLEKIDGRGHRKTMSDCRNEESHSFLKHISQQNTLLAMESCTNSNFKINDSTSLTIDSRQLTNPKMLWKRSFSTEGGLKFGRVNSLGRYERDFDAVDAAYSGTHKNNWSLTMSSSKIKNAMRKLVNLPEDKVQEEIAWQVAEMIVKDVTNVTLCDEKPKPNNQYAVI